MLLNITDTQINFGVDMFNFVTDMVFCNGKEKLVDMECSGMIMTKFVFYMRTCVPQACINSLRPGDAYMRR